MDKKHELTEKLKVLETKIYDLKIDLRSINQKFNIAYDYEEELTQRHVAAKKKTEELRVEFFKKPSEISDMYSEMKNMFDIWTGNYYKNITI